MKKAKSKKIIYTVPPIQKDGKYAMITQNRQFQWYKNPTFIYPMVAAQAVTMLHKAGNAILWIDGVAEELGIDEYRQVLKQSEADVIILEAPTPVIKEYIEIIRQLKENLPKTEIILTGQHVTALPNEDYGKCHVIPGGKWHQDVFAHVMGHSWNRQEPIPHIDRNLTRWWLYAYENGNYKYTPGTYITAAQDCWHRPGCTFCSWANYHKECETRKVDDVLREIKELIEMGFKEIFDDSGTFPVGEWLDEFCHKMIEKGYGEHVPLGCNMRFGALQPHQYQLMRKAGFRMILWGLESANQKTLDLLNKKVEIQSVNRDLILSKAAKLHNHLTIMFGYSWETLEDAKRTYDMARWLLLNGHADSAQATICIPYPGTPLHEAVKNAGGLMTEDWQDYDMSKPIMKVNFDEKKLFEFQKGIYDTAFHPKFIWNKLKGIRSMADLNYYGRIAKKVIGRF